MRQFTVSVVFNGWLHHVLASAHEPVVFFRRKLCSVLSIDCSPHSPVLRTSFARKSGSLKEVALADDKLLLQYNIVNDTQLSIFCPAQVVLAASPTEAVRQVQGAPLLLNEAVLQSARLSVESPGTTDAVVVRVRSSNPVVTISLFLSETGSRRLSVAGLKQLIQVKIGIPSVMQTISCEKFGYYGSLDDDYLIGSDAKTVDCHLMEPSHLFIRLRLLDGTERTEEVSVMWRSACEQQLIFSRFPFHFLKQFSI